jgi:hypothetical protein
MMPLKNYFVFVFSTGFHLLEALVRYCFRDVKAAQTYLDFGLVP